MKRRKWWILPLVLALLAGCTKTNVNSGDRVLVAKFLYETKITEPNRFDVVVFKYPERPVERNVPKNYIKRLLGLPGELIAIFFGRLHRWAPDPAKGEPPLYEDNKDPKNKAEDLWLQKPFMHVDDKDSQDLFDAGRFEIIRKPPAVMLALRRIVYDNDFQADDLKKIMPPRWQSKAGSRWAAADKNFTNDGQAKEDKEPVDWLRYQHLLRPLPLPEGEPLVGGAKRLPELITDHLGYNTSLPNREKNAHNVDTRKRVSRGNNWVGDLMVECQLEVKQPTGEVWLELSKSIYRHQARFKLETGECSLWRQGLKGEPEKVAEAKTKLKGPGSYHVRFANIDSRLTVWVDSDLPFGDGEPYPPPEVRAAGEKISDAKLLERRGPTEKNDYEPASVGVVGATVQVEHLRLWRDTYYTTKGNSGDAEIAPHQPIGPDQWADRGILSAIAAAKSKTLYVQPGHYLCLGDNSPESSDGRAWGAVPHRLMLGRALLVYYPFNRAGLIR